MKSPFVFTILLLSMGLSTLRAQTFSLKDTTFQVGDVLIQDIYFDYNGNGILPRSKPFLDSLSVLMQTHDSLQLEIGNHTDSRGNEKYNAKLSEMRSKMIKHYLVNHAEIKENRLSAVGYGESRPLISNEIINAMSTQEEKESAFQKNRRCEFKIISTSYTD